MLPKIHKENCPRRPIASTYDCTTVYISKFSDIILSPLVQELPSFMKDTPQFLQIIDDFEFPASVNHKPLLPTMDVTSLYTSIPHEGALKARKHFLDKRSSQSMSTSTLLQLIEIVLKMNTLHLHLHSLTFISMADIFLRNKVSPWERKWELVSLAYSWDTWKNCFLPIMNTPHQCYVSDILTTSLVLPSVLKKRTTMLH